jgi:ferredoxin, 2Fe-2S
MTKLIVTDTDGDTREVEAEVGLTIMENIRDNDFEDLAAICGGCCSCCTCHIFVDEEWLDKLPAMEEDERDLLEDSPVYQASSRLSCQIEYTDDLNGIRVTIAPES